MIYTIIVYEDGTFESKNLYGEMLTIEMAYRNPEWPPIAKVIICQNLLAARKMEFELQAKLDAKE